MGNKSSRIKGSSKSIKSSKSMKSQKSMKEAKSAFRTRSLNSLPQYTETQRVHSKPVSVNTSDRKGVVSWEQTQEDAILRNPTQHRRQNTAPEITIQTSPRSLKISDFSKVVHQPEVFEDEDQEDVCIDFNSASEPNPEELCHICSVYTGKIKFLCRICYQVYHLGCLQKLEQHQPSPVVCYLNRAESELGWSCHQCDNLVRLLSEPEITKLISTVEQYNIKQGASLYRQQYLCYKKAAHRDTFKEEITDERLTDERSIFDKLDVKHTGHISWVQFINSEAIRILEKRTKNQLVKILTPGELYRSRQIFLNYDHDRDGEITRFESRMAQMQHFRDISCFPTPTPSKLLFTDEEIGGVISWMDFLRDQAICIIACRRNSFCKDPPKPRDPPEAVVCDVPMKSTVPDKKTKLQTENKAAKTITDEEHVQNTAPTEEIEIKSDTRASVDNVSNPSPSDPAKNNTPLEEAETTSTTVSVKVLEPHTDTVLMRSGRSKSTMANLSDGRTKKLQMPSKRASAAKSADHTIAETEPKLRKVPNVILHEEDHPSKETAISASRESVDDDTSDVVRRFPKTTRGQTMSMYVYESNRRVSSENQMIRRPVSVVGFKMEPTDLVSKLSVKLKTRESMVSQNSIHRLLINDAMNADVQKRNAEAQLPVKDVFATKVPQSNQDAEVLDSTPGLGVAKHVSKDDVEIREREDLFHETKPEIGQFRASDSVILKPERIQKSTRGQTNSLFVTRSERAMLLIDQKDRRPMSLG